jgi:hypothetical protein
MILIAEESEKPESAKRFPALPGLASRTEADNRLVALSVFVVVLEGVE